MPKLYFVLLFGIIGLVSCNSYETKSVTSDTVSSQTTDTTIKHQANTAKSIAALPPVPAGAKVYFKNLKNGAIVKSPFTVEMGVNQIKIDSAGIIVAGEGHHHILIDAGDSVAAGMIIPKDAQHLHFGKGQTVTTLSLPPGKHRLTLQLADGIHRSYGSQLSATIEITVK